MRRLHFPSRGTFIWRDPRWLSKMLVSRREKKLILDALSQLRVMDFASEEHRGPVIMDGQEICINEVLDEITGFRQDTVLLAAFLNTKRHPNRLYIWFRQANQTWFAKVGSPRCAEAFHNELRIARILKSAETRVSIISPKRHVETQDYSALISRSIHPWAMRRGRGLLYREILNKLFLPGLRPEGPFSGIVHCDLTPTNVIMIKNSILVLDWEMGSSSGPDYCDLVSIAVSDLVDNSTSLRDGPDKINAILRKDTKLNLAPDRIMHCVEFLASRGNRRAQAFFRANV